MPAERRFGMDHAHYDWSPIATRGVLHWPEQARVALCVVVNLEHTEWLPPTDSFRPVLTGVALIAMFHQTDPARFAWRQPPYEYEHDQMPIDILAGSEALRGQIDGSRDAREIAESWRQDEEAFRKLRKPFLLY